MKKRKIESIILISIVGIVLIICIIIGIFNNPLIKQNQAKIDNLKNAKSIDVYVISKEYSFDDKKHFIANIEDDSIKQILSIITSAQATVNTELEQFKNDNKSREYEYRNIYLLEIKDGNNKIIGNYYIYKDNHMKLDDYTVTLDREKYNKLTPSLLNIISNSSGSLNCNSDNKEDKYLIVNSKIEAYRNIAYQSNDNLESAKKYVKYTEGKYDGFYPYLILKNESYGSLFGHYTFNITEDTMALVKIYDFDILSEEDTRKLLNISKEDFINRSIDDIKKEYPQDACEYQLW